ncbi:TPA: F0F1 ATP synthase subunit epsilon [Legionella pneumophila]|uniref:F0F1 ATP synthase subunit epsilon n=1 Tax=Legionella bononiensis TaxID=2793102 RepID=A0ABS1WEW6_9GAMM|nr:MULTISPECIES: ATP synthase F0F1 subunit epsilon [Legionellaceae]HAT8857996.1 F0F1 ATP synthase subunit epsilon [Legionella pneumophila subsp. pneumophila]KTD12273.1 F-type H -transporting ATPase epsilon chain [Legionella hackeliae]MBL7478620.1 F0F1 ATP synthase subunit epsilon [Legionella bononiensis]MBL7527820.1 F0F1 ATP synthase subunit epsilon [Legionella bononiensis]MBL7563738.1 F0F1 ATP synthase subunit epsilon [Legionella bononiensis]
MELFTIHLKSATQYEKIDKVISFVGEDASGQFGILAHHSRMMTCLKFGLAWFRDENQETEYLALPGAVVYFIDNQLHIATRHYVRHKEYQAIQRVLAEELHWEENNLLRTKESVHRLDEEMLKRLWELNRQNSYGI